MKLTATIITATPRDVVFAQATGLLEPVGYMLPQVDADAQLLTVCMYVDAATAAAMRADGWSIHLYEQARAGEQT